MKIVAIRDDGALLVAHGDNRAAAIVLEDQTFLTTIDSALARGYWNEPTSNDRVPTDQIVSLTRSLVDHAKTLPPVDKDGNDDD